MSEFLKVETILSWNQVSFKFKILPRCRSVFKRCSVKKLNPYIRLILPPSRQQTCRGKVPNSNSPKSTSGCMKTRLISVECRNKQQPKWLRAAMCPIRRVFPPNNGISCFRLSDDVDDYHQRWSGSPERLLGAARAQCVTRAALWGSAWCDYSRRTEADSDLRASAHRYASALSFLPLLTL